MLRLSYAATRGWCPGSGASSVLVRSWARRNAVPPVGLEPTHRVWEPADWSSMACYGVLYCSQNAGSSVHIVHRVTPGVISVGVSPGVKRARRGPNPNRHGTAWALRDRGDHELLQPCVGRTEAGPCQPDGRAARHTFQGLAGGRGRSTPLTLARASVLVSLRRSLGIFKGPPAARGRRDARRANRGHPPTDTVLIRGELEHPGRLTGGVEDGAFAPCAVGRAFPLRL